MKLSEAILLGSTILAPKAGGQYFSETKEGCALGMAAVARGCTFGESSTKVAESERRTLGTAGVWGPWVLDVAKVPCKYWLCRLRMPRTMPIQNIIAHLFDYHVMSRQNWTLEQLVEWVKTVEPDEPEPVIAVSSPVSDRRAAPWFPRGDRARPTYEELEEWAEWQSVRQAFSLKYDNGLRRRR